MKTFELEFEEVVTHMHTFKIKANLGSDELEDILNEIQDECYTFSDIEFELQERGLTVIDAVEGECNGPCELECTGAYEIQFVGGQRLRVLLAS